MDETSTTMHVLIDLTNSPHVPLFVPLVRRMRAAGVDVSITARRFAQTEELCELHGLDAAVIGAHGGASRVGKARAAIARTVALTRHARRLHRSLPATVGISHGSTDLPIACRRLGVPHVTMFDYEWAATMHRLNCRLSARVVTPDAIPPERLARYGALPKLVQYPGLKEEYYLADTPLDERIRDRVGIPHDAVLAVLRPPPELALYHRGHHNLLFDDVLRRLSAAGSATVVLPRTAEQAMALRAFELPGVVVPEHAVDAQSLIASADLVVSAGGTMNREAVALGTPVYTVFAGALGGVDERLIAEGRMRQLTRADEVVIAPKPAGVRPPLRDPQVLLDLLLP